MRHFDIPLRLDRLQLQQVLIEYLLACIHLEGHVLDGRVYFFDLQILLVFELLDLKLPYLLQLLDVLLFLLEVSHHVAQFSMEVIFEI